MNHFPANGQDGGQDGTQAPPQRDIEESRNRATAGYFAGAIVVIITGFVIV